MDESEDNLSLEDTKSTNSPLTVRNKPKKRSLIERELETNLTSRITSPAIVNDGTSTSRYGRARRLKSEIDQSDMKQVTAELKSPLTERSPVRTLTQSPVYKMHASNSPLKRTESPKKMIEQFLDNQIESIYQENISLSRFSNEEVNAATISPAKKFPKVYIRKDLIQKREPEDTVTVIQNMFSPTKSAKKSSSTHLNNILERSSERYSLNNKSQNGYTGNSSVVKTLDFDSKKKKKDNKDIKVLPSKSELFDLEARCPYQVGDLAWARMGTYPFWPSIVTRDPSTGIYVKKKLFGRIERDVIHVTFFGDNGRRSWIVDNMLRKYVGQLEFEAARENFTPEAKKKDPKLYAAYFISEKKLPLWNNSVEEAEMLLREPKRLRIDLFNDMLAKSRYNKAKQPKSKISRTDSDVSLSESLYDSLFSEEDGKSDVDGSKSRSRKKSFDMFEVVTACLDNMAAKTGISKIQRQSHMDRWLQKAKSKTPEKTQTKTQVTRHKEDKKEATLKVSKKKKSSTPKRKSYPVRKSYSLRKSNESHRLVANEMEVDNEDTETHHTFNDDESSKVGNEICIIAKVESLAQKTQDKKVETVLSNETGHSESVKDSSTCESETYTEEYSNFNNDANNSIINEDKSVISTPNSEIVSKSFISDNSITIDQDSSKVNFEFKKDRKESQDSANSETSNADLSSEIGHSIESGIDEKEFYSGLESKSDDIETQNSTNTKTSTENHCPEVEFNSKKRDSIELRRSSRRNVYSETNNIIAKQDSVAMRNDIDEKEVKSGLESKSDSMEIQNITNMETTNEDNNQEVEFYSKKIDFRRSSRGNIDSEAYNILVKQDSAAMRSSIDEKKLDGGLESKSDNIKIQSSTNMKTQNEDHSSKVEFNCNKIDSVKLRRSSRRNVSSERSNILAKQDSSDIDEKELCSGLKSQSNNIEIQNSTNIGTVNDDHGPKVEFNSKKRDDIDLKRSSRENITSETNNIIAKQDIAAMRTGMEEKEPYSGLESDNIELENSTNTETSNEGYNAKVELNSKKRDSVELRRSSRRNVNSETNNIIAKQDSAAMSLLRPAQVSQINITVQNDTVDNLPANIYKSIVVINTNTEQIQYQNEKVDKYDTSNMTKGGITLTTQENIETFYKNSSNINKDVDDIEQNEAENMSIDDDSDSEHLPYSPLSNLGNNSDDNLSLSEAPFVDDNVTELEKQNIDITNEDNMDKITTKVDEEINVRQELSIDYCDKQNADYNLIERDSEKSKSEHVNNSMSDKIVKNGYIHENDVQSIPQNEDNITGINVLEHKVVLNNNTKHDGKQESINNINNGYRGENVREIEMASKEVRIYVSDSGNKNSKTIKENGFHDINEDFDTASIHSEDSVTSTKSASRHRLRSNQDKKLEDPLLNPEFVKYVELRQDALTEENPDLNKQEIIAYLYKTWLYEESMKSDVKKNDDLRDINLVKGLNPPQSEAPARTKRNLSLNKKEVPKINSMQRYLRRKKDVVDNSENEEIGLCKRRGIRKNMIKDDDDTVSVEEEFGSPNIVKNNADLLVFNLVKDKPKIPTEDELKTSVDTTISDKGVQGKEGQNLPLELTPLSSNNVNEKSSLEQVTSDLNTQTKVKDDFDRESIDSEDSETPLIRCKLRSKTQKENSIDVNIKEEDADTVSINSEDSEISITKRKKKLNGRKIETTMEDPEFLKYLELRQDALIDEHPELTQDEIVTYLYQTWLYEENNKSETKKNDEIQQSTLVKGLKDSVPEPKKYKRKVPKIERAEKDSVDEDIPGKEKPKRKSVKPFYNEEYSDIEEELEVFEIFKPKIHKLSPEQPVNSELNPSVSTSELVQERIEVYDEVELYFAELTKPKPNVFKGLIREKVCEICEKCNNLIKCKGCNGMFHINCVKKETEVVETPVPIRGRKKKKRGRKCKNSEEFDNDDSQDSILEDNTSIEEILETDSHAVDADVLEAQLSAKMKEILDSAEKIDYDSYSSDDCLDWNESVPGKCQIVDVKLKPRRSAFEIENFKCNNCQKYDTPVCFVCKNAVSKQETTKRQKCHFAHCHKYYHLECLDIWPQTQFNGGEPSKNNKKINEYFEALTCPRHVCHTCVSDDPRGCKTRFSGDKLARCVRCPATYHSFTKCLPAGTQILTASHIICPRHYEHRPPGKVPCHVNTGWCFICALGGSLICCEYCPTSFHAECLNIDPPEGGYMCEDCETGRLPLYGEMVWVKLGHYRWWPGIILHPYEIPENLLAVKHSLGEFVVRFFGQYDHYWVNRGRVFPFQEGDSGRVSGQKSKIDAAFTTAMEHAQRACEILKKAVPNEEESMDIASSLLPPHYVKLKVNKPCGSLCGRRLEDPESSLTQCECNPNDEDPCGPYSQCLNRMLLTECGPTCRAGDRCNNRAFEKRLYPKLVPYRTPSRGWGLKTLEDIKAGQFVIEYVGELIDEEEFRRRMRRKHEIRDENFYFLTLDKERMIDAGPKGNLARFMNHCCEPNCETQKWTVLGDVRVGLFALYDIPAHSEVTFNYNLECAGIDKKRCMCGAKRCSGYIGAKPKQEESQSKKSKLNPVKRTYKKRKPEESPSTKSKPKRPIGRPPKPKELTEIEKDLLIIRNATNGLSSDESSKSLSSELDKNPKALKRKRVNFSTEEIVVFDGTESPSVKKSKIDDKLEGD